jgi:hypothetical protein
MHLDQGTWLPQASALSPGRRARVNHDCGPGRTLLIRHDDDGSFHAWCFRCGEGGYHRPERTLAELVAASTKLREADASLGRGSTGHGCALPEPREYSLDAWPVAARLWLYRAGIGKAEAAKLAAFHHAPTERVVVPVWSAGTPRSAPADFYQARAYQPGRQPKYLGPDHRPPWLVACFQGRVDTGDGHDGRRGHQPPRVVLTEDILSAFKISLTGEEAWPVMGTSVPASYVAELMRRGVQAVTWLDPDAAGRKAAARYGKQLRAYGVPVRDIVSARDPKLHHLQDIKEILA